MTASDRYRDSDGDPDPYAIVGEFWPYDGPYNGWTTSSAALAMAELIRYLNNATGKRSALPDVQTVSRVLSNLNSTAYGYDQLFSQLATFVASQADDPTLYDDRAPDAQGGDTARELAAEIVHARHASAVFRTAVERAASLASRLGNRTNETGDPS